MSARDLFAELGIMLPGNAATGNVSVRCFANPGAHKHDDKNLSCSVSLDTGQWKCFGCGAKGSAFDAAVAVGWLRSDATELAKRHDVFATDREQPNGARQARRRGNTKPGGLPTDAQLAGWRDALLGSDTVIARLFELRGWTREAIYRLELGYDAGWKRRDGGPIVFPVRDPDGRLVGVLHYQPNPAKRAGKKMWAAKGTPRALFPPPETLPADATVYVCEGEGDAVALRSLGLHAVAVPGAQGWKPEWAARFAGRDVVLIPDLDAVGRRLMAEVARDLLPHAASVRVVDMDATRDDGGDVGDLVRDAVPDGADGLTQARRLVERMANAAPVIEPPAIEQTGALLDAVRGFARRYVILSEAQSVAVALWVMHTHAIDAADSTPYLSITSAERECGKTRLLETLDLCVARPWFTGRTTAAALARKTDAERPTLLLDESDATFNGDKEYAETLRGVLNTGYRRGGKTTVCVGQATDMTTRDFSTFGAKAIAGIGELPDTVASRSIPIRLKRRTSGETVARFKRKVADAQAAELRERASVWAAQHEKVLADADPGSLSELGDRADEVWEPLRAIADLAGGDWPELARMAAIELSARVESDDEQSNGVLLLSAIRGAMRGGEKIATADLLAQINADDELPFGGFRKGEGLDTRGLGKRLRPYGIKSGTIRLDANTTAKGYSRDSFEDAWARYLPVSPEKPSQASQASQDAEPSQENPREHWAVTDVTDVTDRPGIGTLDRHTTVDQRHNGTPQTDAAPELVSTLDDRLRRDPDVFRRELAAEELAVEPAWECGNRLAHWDHHVPHPVTGRSTCLICHPPAAVLAGNGSRP